MLKGRDGEIDVVDTSTFEVIDTIEAVGPLNAGAVDSSTGMLCVINGIANTVSVIAATGA